MLGEIQMKFFHGDTYIEIENQFNIWSKGKAPWVKDTQLSHRGGEHVLLVTYCDKLDVPKPPPFPTPTGPRVRRG